MLKTKKSVLLVIGFIVVISIFVYYQYAKNVLMRSSKQEVAVQPNSKEVDAVVSYDAYEGKIDTLRFVVLVDRTGMIQEIKTLDAATNEVPEKKKEFNEQVNVLLKGKKLAELTTIDKVGTSSKTTEAFNKALGELKSEL